MLSSEKFNIYVPSQIAERLEEDARLFEVFKPDGKTINMNRFLSMLLQGYYKTYAEENRIARDMVCNVLKSYGIPDANVESISEEIVNKAVFPEIHMGKGIDSTKYAIKPTYNSELLYDVIGNKAYSLKISKSRYIRRMLANYCKKPRHERERIIFHDEYDKLDKACSTRSPVTFVTKYKKHLHNVIPYKLVHSKEEMFNYLLCAEYNKEKKRQEAKPYRLNLLSGIISSEINNVINDNVIEYLDRMIECGPQYQIDDDNETCVRLDENGEEQLKGVYFGRPIETDSKSDSDGCHHYRCSENQLFLYFRRFDGAEIIKPESLRKRIIEFHEKALEPYRKKKKL